MEGPKFFIPTRTYKRHSFLTMNIERNCGDGDDARVKGYRRPFSLSLVLLLPVMLYAALACCAQISSSKGSGPPFLRIDVHAHVFNTSPSFYAMLRRLNIRLLDICVVDKFDRGYEEADPQNAKVLQIMRDSSGLIAWCSTFDPQDWKSASFAQRTVAKLDKTFEQGAIAVKIYKSIGMNLKSRTGRYLMPDDPVFDPIFNDIEAHGKTLTMHLADESDSWKPPDPASPYYDYFKNNPMWCMHRFPGSPTKEAILAA